MYPFLQLPTTIKIEDYTIEEDESEPRSRRMEMLLGLALVVAVLGFVLFSYLQQQVQVGHYHAGVDALNNREPDRAIAELQQTDGYLDSAALIETARSKINERNRLYEQANGYASAGKWWQTARTLLKMQDVQKSYQDSDALLAHARDVNGPIYYTHIPPYLQSDDGVFHDTRGESYPEGIYAMQADGKAETLIPSTSQELQVFAIALDGRNVIFSTSNAPPSLYNSDRQSITILDLPGTSSVSAAQKATFSADGKTLTVETTDTAFTFDVSAVGSKAIDKLEPIAQESRAEYQRKHLKSLILHTWDQGQTEMEMSDPTGQSPHAIAIETGRVDGALFTKDQRYLLYRVCALTNNNTTFECSLRLANLTSQAAKVQTITTVQNIELSKYDTGLLGEFTQDNNHIVLFIQNGAGTDVLLYSIATGETSKLQPDIFAVTTGRGENDVYTTGSDYLLDDYIPGLEAWTDRNLLGRTDQNLRRSTDGYTRIRSQWITISPNDRFALTLNSHITESTRYYKLSVTALTWNSAEAPDKSQMLFSTKDLPRDWISSTRPLADGYTLVTSATIASNIAPNVHIYSLDGDGEGDVTLANAAKLLEVSSSPGGK